MRISAARVTQGSRRGQGFGTLAGCPSIPAAALMWYEARMGTNPEVDAWFRELDHPLKAEMQRVREIVLGADDRITEAIKWKTPTFMYEGNIASFNPRAKAHVSVLFHTGAMIPGSHPLLEGGGDTARYARFEDFGDVEAKREQVEAAVHAWCAMKDGV